MRNRGLLWIVAFTVAGCLEVADPASSLVAFLVTPVFDSNGAFAADADRVKVTLEREEAPNTFTQVAQLFVNIDPATGEVDTTLTVPLFQSPTRFRVILEAIRSSDGVVLYRGVDTVSVSSGTTSIPVEVPVTYVGPVASTLVLAPADTAVEAGRTFTFRTSTFGPTGSQIDVPVRFYLVRPADSVLLRVDRRSGQATTATGAQGETRVYATTPNGVAADTARVLIGAIPARVALDPGYSNVAVGSTRQFSGAVVDALGNPLSVFAVQWTTRNAAVATVDATGRVTGVAPGTAVIVVQAADLPGAPFSDSALVTVPVAGNVVVSTTANDRAFVRAAVSETIEIAVTADMSFVDELLGSYNAVLTWNPAVLTFVDVQAGDFPAPELNTLNTEVGELRFAQANANGSPGVVVLARVRFTASATGSTPMTLAISEMSAAQTFTNLFNRVTVTNGTVTVQ